MNTKVCSKCGWGIPGESPARSCPLCKIKYTMGYCNVCEEWSTDIFDGLCKPCRTKKHNNWSSNKLKDSTQQLDDWLKLISIQPKDPLTNAQWFEACRYFKGCAYCGDPEIASRSMFIPFKLGGRYTVWNIVPACEKCETALKSRPNPFERLNKALNRHKGNVMRKNGYNSDAIDNITKYLQSKMEGPDESGQTDSI